MDPLRPAGGPCPTAKFCDACAAPVGGARAAAVPEAGERNPRAYTPEHLADGVHRFEGTVNPYKGDGIMALFGAPIAHEDHAQRAAYAALTPAGELRGSAQELRRDRGRPARAGRPRPAFGTGGALTA